MKRMADWLENDYPNYPHYPDGTGSSDELARRRRPPFLPMAAQHVAFLSGRAHSQRKTTVYDDCDILRQLLAPASMRNREQRPGMEHKRLFNEPAVFHSQRVRGQWFRTLNKLTRVFNKCSTPESMRKKLSKSLILGRYMWSLFLK
jgi:hypothetical protein